MRTIWTACLIWVLVGPSLVGANMGDTDQHTIKAVSCAARPVIDGQLAPGEWDEAATVSHFTQMEPDYGAASRHPTTVFVMYDAEFLFVAAVCRDAAGIDLRIADIGRDYELSESDGFGFVLDLWHDRRNAVGFFTNPSGAQLDLQSFDERVTDADWNTVWHVRTDIADSGWACEFAIPWKSLRYPKDTQAAGINFLRIHRRSNEWSVWSPYSRGYSVYRMDEAGTLTGLRLSVAPRNLAVTPYALARSGDHTSTLDVGGDLQWSPDPKTTMELTANTDFAQADVDRSVINLDRFDVLFPERRQFFLENSGMFLVAGNSLLLQPFFSRRIGLDLGGRPEYLDAGLRFLRRGAGTSVGLLAVRTRSRDSSLTSYHAVARASRNFGEQNRIGGLLTFREDVTDDGRQRNAVGAIDGFARPDPHLALEYAITASMDNPDGSGRTLTGGAGLVSAVYRTDALNIFAGETIIDAQYSARTGFVGWQDIAATEAGVDYFWRPRWKPDWLQEMAPAFYVNTVHRASDRRLLETQLTVWPVYLSFKNGGVFYVLWHPTWEHLESAFTPVNDVTIEADDYNFHRILAKLATDPSARLGARVYCEAGSFYDGSLTSLRPDAHFRPSTHLSLATAAEWNWFRSVGSSATTATASLYSAEIEVAVNPRLQFSTFYEHDRAGESDVFQWRMNWEFHPLSHVFVVYSANEDATSAILKLAYRYQL